MNEVFDETLREMQLISSDDEGSIRSPFGKEQKLVNKIQMRKQLGLLEGVAIILGIIFGSGILKL